MFPKKVIKKIPIIKRLYPSLMKRFYNNKIIRFKFFDIELEGNINEPMDRSIFFLTILINKDIIYRYPSIYDLSM